MLRSKAAKVMVSWAFVITAGVGSFVLVKRQVDQSRYEIMKSKDRMRTANLSVKSPEDNTTLK